MHACYICGKEFSLGQALGGHMRRHRVGVNEEFSLMKENKIVGEVPILKRSNSKRVMCLDLNLTPLQNDLKLLFGNMAPKVDSFPPSPLYLTPYNPHTTSTLALPHHRLLSSAFSTDSNLVAPPLPSVTPNHPSTFIVNITPFLNNTTSPPLHHHQNSLHAQTPFGNLPSNLSIRRSHHPPLTHIETSMMPPPSHSSGTPWRSPVAAEPLFTVVFVRH
ncbi:hypothetical protein KIW84_061848 [Lathyrus oleraceus]|uniref:C2H2-type domain-containing protein n=1 Tax=Pisum sativum TaxID=3888 RepID=A0A9D5A5P9_PEA|nr:hypothetical protein KIW84_061848 [Pisum sativum]